MPGQLAQLKLQNNKTKVGWCVRTLLDSLPIFLHPIPPPIYPPMLRPESGGDDGPPSSPVGLSYWSHSEWVSVPWHLHLSSPPHQSHASVTIPAETGLHFVPKSTPLPHQSPCLIAPHCAWGVTATWQQRPLNDRNVSQSLPLSPAASKYHCKKHQHPPTYPNTTCLSKSGRPSPTLYIHNEAPLPCFHPHQGPLTQ